LKAEESDIEKVGALGRWQITAIVGVIQEYRTERHSGGQFGEF